MHGTVAQRQHTYGSWAGVLVSFVRVGLLGVLSLTALVSTMAKGGTPAGLELHGASGVGQVSETSTSWGS